MIWCLLLKLELCVFNFLDSGAKIENKTALIFFVVSEIFNLLFPDKIVESSAVLLINQSLTSEQNAITRHNIMLIEDDNISWYKLRWIYLFEPGILTVN